MSATEATSRANSLRATVWCPGAQALSTPLDLRLSLVGENVQVSWAPVAGARNYLFDHFWLIDGRWESPQGNTWRTLPGSQTSVNLTPPVNARVMLIYVAALNDCSQSTPNSLNQLVPRRPPPPTAVGLTVSDSGIRVSWDTNCISSGDGAECLRWTYVARLEPDGRECTVVGAGFCEIRNVRPGQTYVARVLTQNQWGQSAAVQSNAVTMLSPPRPPAAVRVQTTRTSAAIQWRTTPQSSGIRYLVEAQPGGQSCRSTKDRCVVTGLKPDTKYRFSVIAVSRSGSSKPSFTSTSTKPLPQTATQRPGRPTNPSRPSQPSRPSPTPQPSKPSAPVS
jgi:hypothetical protein